MCRQTLKDLFHEFRKSSNHFLSHEDIREDVIFDEEATQGNIRTLIWDARRWLRLHKPEYEILVLWGKGYRLRKRRKQQ